MSVKNLEERMKAAGGAIKLLRDSQTGPNPYPVVKPEYTQLARRAVGVAERRDPLQPVVPHDGPVRVRPGCVQAAREPRHQQLQGLRARQGQAVRARDLGRSCDRRRDPVLPRQEQVQPDRPSAGASTGCTYHAETGKNPRTGKKWQVKLVRDDRSADRKNPLGAQDLPLPDPGSERDEGDDEGAEEGAAGSEVLQHGRRSRSPASRCVRCAMAWPASRASSCSDRRRTARPCTARS